MPNYVVTGKANGSPLVAVSIDSINQETQVIQEIDVVNAVRDRLAAVPGVTSVVAQKYEQVITVV